MSCHERYALQTQKMHYKASLSTSDPEKTSVKIYFCYLDIIILFFFTTLTIFNSFKIISSNLKDTCEMTPKHFKDKEI